MVEKYFLKFNWFLVIIFSLPAAWALLVPGFFGASDDLHIAWLYEMDRAIKSGQIPPRFVPDLSFGFGYPLFNFVFPLPFYLAEIFHLLGLNLVDSIKAVFFISIPLSGVMMYRLLKEFVGEVLSVTGALVYVYTPYRATDIYIRGAIGEAVVFTVLPLVALSVVKLTAGSFRQGIDFRWIGIGALSLASLSLSHNITAYMFLPFVFLLAILRLVFFRASRMKMALQLILMVFLGLLMGIYFWLPAVTDSGLMVYDTVFNFIDHFPEIKQLLFPYWGYGASVPGPGDGMSFFIGSINLLLVISAVVFLCRGQRYSKEEKILLLWLIASFLIAFFMMNYRSTLFWQSLPLLPYFQFPWRFLIVTTFVTPLCIVAFSKFKFSWYLVVLIPVVIFLNYSYFTPQDFLGRQDDYYLRRYIPVPQASEEYKGLQEEYLRLTRHTLTRPDKNYPLVVAKDDVVKEVIRINDLKTLVNVSTENNVLLEYNKYFFPGWRALIDGKEVPIIPGQLLGQITIQVPPGNHQVQFSFGETTFKKVLDLVSLVSLLSALVLVINPRRSLIGNNGNRR